MTKVSIFSKLILIIFVSYYFMHLVVNGSVMYKILNDRKINTTTISAMKVETVVQCAKQCTAKPECKSAQFKNKTCDLLEETYSCINPSDIQLGWQYIYICK